MDTLEFTTSIDFTSVIIALLLIEFDVYALSQAVNSNGLITTQCLIIDKWA